MTANNYRISTFEEGKVYEYEGDSGEVHRVLVTRRTLQNLWLQELGESGRPEGRVRCRAVLDHGYTPLGSMLCGTETCYPEGCTCSSSILRADTREGYFSSIGRGLA